MSLYIPFVQNAAKNIAIEKLEQSTGMDIELERLRLRFPLRVELDRLAMMPAPGDTMLSAARLSVDVAFWPLLSGKLVIDDATLDDATYRLNNPDSAIFLTARINRFATSGTGLKFNMQNINVGRTTLDGADIVLHIKDTITVSSPDTTAATPMVINAPDIELRNVSVRMQMLPTIDSLYAHIDDARLLDARLDMAAHTIDAGRLQVDSISATYLLPSADFLSTYPQRSDSTAIDSTATASASTPWSIKADEIRITGRSATYAVRGATPTAGFDMNYIQASDIDISIDSFYNCGTSLRVPLHKFAATERCGIRLKAAGVFEMDSTAIQARGFSLYTKKSAIMLNALMGMGNMKSDPTLPISLKTSGVIAMSDAEKMMPALGVTLRDLPEEADIKINADINGSTGSLDVDGINIFIDRFFNLNASGHVDNPMDFNAMKGKIKLKGNMRNINFVKAIALDRATAKTLLLPAFTIDGDVDYSPGLISGDVALRSGKGRIGARGRWAQRAESYNADLSVNDFPVQAFMPSLGVSDLTAKATVKGHGYDPGSRRTQAQADIFIDHVGYNGASIDNVTLNAKLDTCRLNATINSLSPDVNLSADVIADFTPEGYQWVLSGDMRHLDLKALQLTADDMNGSVRLNSTGRYNPHNGDIDATLHIDDLDWNMGASHLAAPQATAQLLSTDSLTRASLSSGDFNANISALCRLDTLLARFTRTSDIVNAQIADRYIDVREIQRSLPPMMNVSLTSGRSNIAANYLAAESDIHFKDASLTLHNDSLISMQAAVNTFSTGSTRLDKITLDANQHGRFLVYRLSVDNKPGTMDDFAHVSLNGFVAEDKVSAMFKQSDIHDRQGFYLGINAAIADSTVTVRFVPYKPTIAYKKWTINRDNEMQYNFATRHLDANLKLMSDNSSLHIYTEHPADTLSSGQEDVIVKLDNINLAEWLSISPFAPPVKGDLDADLRFRWDKDQITGNGTVDLNDLYYGRDRVGTFSLDLDVANDSHTKALRANVALMVDSVKVITASGNLNDSTAVNPFLLNFSMIHFPLRVVNPFLSKDVAQLSGMLNGQMDITGDLANPIFNGFLDFDSTAVKLGITGMNYRFSEEKIPVDSNIVRFNDFTIAGLNQNSLHINGSVDARHLSDINLDLALKASDMQLVNSNRPRGANVYGKAFIDLDASVKGNMSLLRVNADLDLLPGTNVTYVMEDAAQTLAPQSTGDMVRFVQFSDSAQVAKADSIAPSGMAMLLDARLAISEGATINVDLSPDGKNKASIQGNGNFTYSLTPINGAGRITGRYNINGGFVRYTPQISTGGLSMSIMSEKNFKFVEGSYIAFTGDMLNPTLNVKAVERLKANVTQSGQNSRLVNFDISVSVTNTLENMNVVFDMSTDDDITIENELRSMSPEQRANQAMNMLLYNQYTGPGTKANANLSGNPLYSFLASQLNSWAANNIRGVDISFGIDQYDKTTDGSKSTTTSYSYRVSKSLFNDRFKIVIGGNYSTDADADENFEQNLINDISFEYMLNRSGSMYVRLFRHVGYESILEGEITQTGVGFVLKRKLNSLRDIFRFARKP